MAARTAATTSPRPLVKLPPATPPTATPFNVSPRAWQRLKTAMHTATVTQRQPLQLCTSSSGYVTALDQAVTLRQARSRERFYGMRLPRVQLWPLKARQMIEMCGHQKHPTTVGWVGEAAVRALMLESAELRRFFVEQMVLADDYAREQLLLNTNQSAHCRIAHLLLALDGDVFPQPIACGHHALSHMLNLMRETVSHVLGNFQRAGLIRSGYRRIQLLDQTMLRRIATTF